MRKAEQGLRIVKAKRRKMRILTASVYSVHLSDHNYEY